ncbi:MAG: YbcC family protein [Rhodospirillales bacterium]|jgi:uncharacterized protein YbcC (UPF0753/DUF2309 family)
MTASPALETAIGAACNRIAPLWPLKHFVAVNPFLGFAERSFAATCATLKRVARTDMLMPRNFYQARIADGFVTDADLAAALEAADAKLDLPRDFPAFKHAALAAPNDAKTPPRVIATVADVLEKLAHGDRFAAGTAFMIDEISKFCAGYYDEAQAAWKMPWRDLAPYAAWRAAMRFDRNPEAMGVAHFRQNVASLPEDARAAIAAIVAALGIPERAVADYLHRALFDIQGWAAYVRYRVWDDALYGLRNEHMVELLAIRLAWGYALFKERNDPAFLAAWAAEMQAAAATPDDELATAERDLAVDIVLQNAFEIAYQRGLLQRLKANIAARPNAPQARKAVQAAFCIDVRSEIFRRALETAAPSVETIGFAGFFGFPIEYVPIGNLRGGAQCPVLLTPGIVVCEHVANASPDEETEILGLRLLRRRAAKAWKSFKLSAVSSFTYVETLGLAFGAKLAGDGLGLTRPVPNPAHDGLDRFVSERLGPRIEPRMVAGRATGFEPERRVAMAEAVLRAMSMTGNFARLVLLAGHGSTTVNNPHASGLDCGACGGHTGEANARVAAAILNDARVREGLRTRGLDIPDDTWFLGCLHDTATDRVTIYNASDVPQSHRAELAQLEAVLAKAGALARAERAGLLALDAGGSTDAQIDARSRDWSQVRPEWGLAGNAAFIAAPRERTQGLDLGGRAFLHNYDWTQDSSFGVLELIMTAPMVVASWINLQYYGSTVNNRSFGSGNKVLHNVVGALGVLEGNGGDLKTGLPFQSVHDGKRFVHEPLRLNVFIEAPEAEMNRIIAKHEGVRQLVDNVWVHLYALVDEGRSIRRYRGDLQWAEF